MRYVVTAGVTLWLLELGVLLVAGPTLYWGDLLEVMWASVFLVGLACAVVLPLGVGLEKKWPPTVACVLVVLALNYQAFLRGFWYVPISAAACVAVIPWLAGQTKQWLRVGFRLAVPIGLLVLVLVNRQFFPHRYLLQHLALSLVGFWGAMWWWRSLQHSMPLWASGVFGVAGLAFVGLFSGHMSVEATAVATKEMPTSKAMAQILMPLADWDGDGYGILFVSADCNDADPRVNPGALEVPDNGVDDNCVGGDAQVWQPLDAKAHKKPPFRKILLITIDALRADRVYGPLASTVAPTLAALAGRCTAFTEAYASYASTMQSVLGLMTSRYASLSQDTGYCRHLPMHKSSSVSVAGVLGRNGWRTQAVVGTWALGKECGLSRDFDKVWNATTALDDPTPGAREVTDRTIAALAGPAPYFVWAHYLDPHEPYFNEHPAIAGHGDEGRYNAEIHHVDLAIARILEGLPPDVLVVIAADHGEGFHKNHHVGHVGYEPHVLHVPLLFCGPGIVSRQVTTPVSLLDVAPTLVSLAGLGLPPGFLGQSLETALFSSNVSKLRGWAAAEYVGPQGSPFIYRTVIAKDFRLVADHAAGVTSVYRNGVVTRSAGPVPDQAARQAFEQLMDGHLQAAPGAKQTRP